MDNISIKPVTNMIDLYKIRSIRNGLRKFLTHYNKELSPIDQLLFICRYLSKKRAELTIYTVKKGRKLIGYGLISYNKGVKSLTGGLIRDERGKGYGEILFKHLIKECGNSRVRLDVFKDNQAIKLYLKLGFRIFRRKDNIIYMYLP